MLYSIPGKFLLLRKEKPVIGNDDRLDALAGKDRERAVDSLRVARVDPHQRKAGSLRGLLHLGLDIGIVRAFGIEKNSHTRQVWYDRLQELQSLRRGVLG